MLHGQNNTKITANIYKEERDALEEEMRKLDVCM